MTLTMGIGALLLGGWVLVTPPVDQGVRELSLPLNRSATPQTEAAQAPAYVPAPHREAKGQQPDAATPSRPKSQPRPKTMPQSPTESTSESSEGTIPLPPTQPTPEGMYGFGSRSFPGSGAYGSGGSQLPMAPTYRRPVKSTGNMPVVDAFDQQRTQLAAATTPQKAFATWQPPQSGVSPYMNLFRNDTSNGTLDNYTTLVRPQLQQNTANQQFGNDIFGLQRNARIQSAALQQVNRNTRNLQGVGTPQYYQNTNNGYYPGYGP